MRLRRLYSNKAEIFSPIEFHVGLSAVLAEIRLPANRLLDTHNLGKTTVGELIDFCLLKGKSKPFFLFKHFDLFASFIFYLEIELESGEFITIGRPVDPGSKIDLKRSERSIPDITCLADPQWDHTGLPFDRALTLLDGILGLDALAPWKFRKLVGYLLRSQQDYLDVFQLGKFSGKHQEWKPFVAKLLGLESETVVALYEQKTLLESSDATLASLLQEWGDQEADMSVLDGLISVKRRALVAKSDLLDSFSFGEEDKRIRLGLVEETETRITALNDEAYALNQLVARIKESLRDGAVQFKPGDAERLFMEAGIAFGDQLKRDFEQLIAFNRAITRERREALTSQQAEASARLSEIDAALQDLNARRTQALEFMRESDSLQKYKMLSREVAALQTELGVLDVRRAAASRIAGLRREKRALTERCGQLQSRVESEIELISVDEESRFGMLRRYFGEIIHEVLGQDAVIAIRVNGAGGLDFTAELVSPSGTATSADKGTSYKKLMCIAFDLAMLRAHLDVPFPRFVFHDGALEQLEPRKKAKLIHVFREYADLGLQPIISLLDSDLPAPLGSSEQTISPAEVVTRLHDDGDGGRLFSMPPW